MKDISPELKKEIIDIIAMHPELSDPQNRESTLYAVVDRTTLGRIKFDGASIQFAKRLVLTLLSYGGPNGENYLSSMLSDLKESAGDAKDRYAQLIERLDSEFAQNDDQVQNTKTEIVSGFPAYLPFCNRETEVKDFILDKDFDNPYCCFVAPPGYGKSRLLTHICNELGSSWLCIPVKLEGAVFDDKFALQFYSPLGMGNESYTGEDPSKLGVDVGAMIKSLQKEKRLKGCCITIDDDGEPTPSKDKLLRIVTTEVLPAIFSTLMDNGGYFRDTPKSFRVAIASRRVPDIEESVNGKPRYKPVALRPFEFAYVIDLTTRMKDVLGWQDTDALLRGQFAAQLLYHSAGHPGCMRDILYLYYSARKHDNAYSIPWFFKHYRPQIRKLARQTAERVHDEIRNEVVRNSLEHLCMFRKLDPPLVDYLAEEDSPLRLSIEPLPTPYLLYQRLLSTNVYHILGDGPLAADDIIRRVMLIWLRSKIHEDEFQARLHHVADIYEKQATSRTESLHVWIAEWIYTQLQLISPDGHERLNPSRARESFFEHSLRFIEGFMKKQRNPMILRDSLVRLLQKDWELEFCMNYHLSDDLYSDAAFRSFIVRIKDIFAA